jgi:tRNA-Thr(GGU) m(6)t(6)A37 methyltransferase TsaA
MRRVEFDPIGLVESPFADPDDVPRPAIDPVDASGRVVLDDRYEPGILGLEEFSHVQLVSHLHEADDVRLRLHPGDTSSEKGIFATSGPARPNPIGISTVRLDDVTDTTLSVSDLDLVDGTPVLDVKPFAPKEAHLADLRIGWMAEDEE